MGMRKGAPSMHGPCREKASDFRIGDEVGQIRGTVVSMVLGQCP